MKSEFENQELFEMLALTEQNRRITSHGWDKQWKRSISLYQTPQKQSEL